jgi:hypothetical protein
VTGFIDRGAIVAGWVGVGMAVVMAVSFLLVIPIEPIYWLLALPAGLLIGYYANARSERRSGSIGRIAANALFAGVVTGLTLVVLLLGVKALFFYADDGYRDAGRLRCSGGASCVYARYRSADRDGQLAAAGVTDVESFTRFYWAQQASTSTSLFGLTLAGGLAGGLIFTLTRGSRAAASPA